jgi:DNA-binding response OmpR family regulator
MPNTRRILIVDDDPELRDALSEQLSLYEEFEAVAAEDGSKGVQAAKAGQIDLVIMDVGLPDIDGLLRKELYHPSLLIEAKQGEHRKQNSQPKQDRRHFWKQAL